MKKLQKTWILLCTMLLSLWIQGCANQTNDTVHHTVTESSEQQSENNTENKLDKPSNTMVGDSFASMYYNTADSFHCFKSLENKTTILDYESMETAKLCNKPNCNHLASDCLVSRLTGNVPMFSGTDAYYFIDEEASIESGADGKPALKLGSTLYRFDLTSNTEEKLVHVDGISVSNNCYGWLLHDGVVYFIGNHYNTIQDENNITYGYHNTGGDMELYSVDFATLEIQNHGDLYDVPKLTKYFPETPNSGEVSMRGVFDGKIYFNVGFVAEQGRYSHYVTYFDLNSQTYHGEPENYADIDFGTAAFVSEDYLVIAHNGYAEVYKAGEEQPVILSGDDFRETSFSTISVFDDTLFIYGKAYDLNTKAVRTIASLTDKQIIAKYGDSYIISDSGMQQNFEKIPVTDLLPE